MPRADVSYCKSCMSSANVLPPDESFHLKMQRYVKSELVYLEHEPFVYVPLDSLFATMISRPIGKLFVDLANILVVDETFYKIQIETVDYCLKKLYPPDMKRSDISRKLVSMPQELEDPSITLVPKASLIMHFILINPESLDFNMKRAELVDARFYKVNSDLVERCLKEIYVMLDALE